MQEPLDKIRIGQLQPESLTIRLLLPDASRPFAVPCRKEDLADDPEFRFRATQIMRRHAESLLESVNELRELGLVRTASAEIRLHNCAPLFKLYILNRSEVYFGFYPIREHTVSLPAGARTMYDLMGKEALLFHSRNGFEGSIASQYSEQANQWFDSMWAMITREFQP